MIIMIIIRRSIVIHFFKIICMFTIFVTPVEKLTAIVEIEDFPTGLGTSTRLVILTAAASLVEVVLLLLLLLLADRGRRETAAS